MALRLAHLLVVTAALGAAFATPAASATGYFELHGRQIYFQEAGAGQPLVVIHGFPDHSGNFTAFVDELSDEFHVFAYDRSGAGRSDKPKGAYNLTSFLEELREVLRARGLVKPILLGHSFGGTVAMAYAVKHPTEVSGLVLINAVYKDFTVQTGMNKAGAWLLHLPALGETMMVFQYRGMTRSCLKMAFYDPSLVTEEMVERYHQPFSTPGAKSSYLAAMRSIYAMQPGDLGDLAQIPQHHIPTLLLWSEKDWSMSLAMGQALAATLHAKFVVIPGIGHSHLELDPIAFRRDVAQPIKDFFPATPPRQ